MACVLSAFSDEAGGSCAEQIAGLRRAGLHYMDIRNIDGHNITVLPLEQARIIRPLLDAAGLRVNMFGSPLGKIDLADDFQIDIGKLKHMGALAPILGCRAVRIFSYYNKTGKPAAEFRKMALQRLNELAKIASDLGMVLYHENEGAIFGEKVSEIEVINAEVVARWTPKVFGLIFDFGNYNAAREDVWANWLRLRDMTHALHLKDNVLVGDGFHHVVVGQGGGCVERILADAAARGFSGPLTVEPHLQHSAAVLATGVTGQPNQAYNKMSGADSFHAACTAARELCKKVGLATT
jgi:sugar phosphate isomerase/epimerase